MGLGNVLYLWLWTFSRQRAGDDAVVRYTGYLRPWATWEPDGEVPEMAPDQNVPPEDSVG